ncbi:MAG: folylpolyglutamate synthase/dihydrofolate synthase family protein [Bacteroidota bacterium]
MTYQETLSWMFSRLPMYQQKGAAALNHKLDNIQDFSTYLGNPHQDFKSIHVAGTNGKGSSSHMIASVLQEAGYTVGLYTSPHLKDFRERIKVNGTMISEEEVMTFVKSHKPFLEANGLSFFEMTVGMAFQYFSLQKVDVAVIEVGLGGRLDSTNIIQPEICLITNIGWDHQSILGDTLEKIAMEKAGIIKRQVPVVISETQKETQGIFKLIAAQKRSPIFFAEDVAPTEYETDLKGGYQHKNMRGVVTLLQKLEAFEITSEAIEKGLSRVVDSTGLLGRWQVLGSKPKIICDTAHNEQGLKDVLKQLKKEKGKNVHLVLGFVNDKDVEVLLKLFPKKAQYYFVSPNVPRGLESNKLKKIAKRLELKGKAYESVNKGLKAAKKASQKEDIIFIGGSTFTVAEVV